MKITNPKLAGSDIKKFVQDFKNWGPFYKGETRKFPDDIGEALLQRFGFLVSADEGAEATEARPSVVPKRDVSDGGKEIILDTGGTKTPESRGSRFDGGEKEDIDLDEVE